MCVLAGLSISLLALALFGWLAYRLHIFLVRKGLV